MGLLANALSRPGNVLAFLLCGTYRRNATAGCLPDRAGGGWRFRRGKPSQVTFSVSDRPATSGECVQLAEQVEAGGDVGFHSGTSPLLVLLCWPFWPHFFGAANFSDAFLLLEVACKSRFETKRATICRADEAVRSFPRGNRVVNHSRRGAKQARCWRRLISMLDEPEPSLRACRSTLLAVGSLCRADRYFPDDARGR